MTERAEFSIDTAQVRAAGWVLIALGLACAAMPLMISGLGPDLTAVYLILGAAVAGCGPLMWRMLRRTGVQVVVDRDGITDLRLSPDPILWSEVQRIGLTGGIDRVPRLRLVLRRGSPLVAGRFRSGQVVIDDLVLTGGFRAVRAAIARLAPQVPRDW